MFYGIPPERQQKFDESLHYIVETFGGNAFAADMLITLNRNLSFLLDSRFVHSFNSMSRTEQERSLIWRLHVLCWAASQALGIEGDFVECGVLKGFCSGVICKYLDFETQIDRTYWLYDTFSGLAEEVSSPEEFEGNRRYGEINQQQWLAQVKERFAAYPNVRIVQGTVPFSFEQACPERVAFVHLDLNAAQAELLALQHLFDRMPRGAVVVMDDFGWNTCRSLMKTHMQFFAERGHKVLELPTGQGLVMKH